MKKIMVLMIVILSFVSCNNQNKLSLEDYSHKFYVEITAYEQVLENELYLEATDLINSNGSVMAIHIKNSHMPLS